MDKQQFLAMSAITDLKGFVDGRSTNVGPTMYTLHSVPNKCKTVQIASTMDEDEFYVDIDKFKPILHPLSDLTNEIEHNGEKFVPMDLIKKEDSFLYYGEMDWIDDCALTLNADDMRYFTFSHILKFIEWHFDVAGLIEQGEAINVNALDVNPYK